MSTTVTVCVQVAVLPAASVAVQVTVVLPMGKLAGASFVMVGAPQLSVPVALFNVAEAVQSPGAVFTVVSLGQEMVGF